jgi:hypothetical protein
METEEKMVRRHLDLPPVFGTFNADAEAEINQIMCDEISREIVKSLKRMVNNVPTVSDKLRRLPNK